ncbi:MAG: ABC transporter permease subunit [Holosporales bacterium]|jgi:His/Glu/Gln/Arg/opine family amino acid ABC transporter permease subunit
MTSFSFISFAPLLLEGFGWTVLLALSSAFGALVVGAFLLLLQRSGIFVLQRFAVAYAVFFRSVPELIVLLALYFGGSVVVNSISEVLGVKPVVLSPFVVGILGLSLSFGALVGEVLRGVWVQVPVGDIDAGRSLGMGRWLRVRRLVLPQIVRLALPGLGNVFLVLLKDTALVSVISVPELMRQTQVAVAATGMPFAFYIAAAGLYLMVTMVSTAVLRRGEAWARRGYG